MIGKPFVIKIGDTARPYVAVIRGGDGQPVDLAGASSIRFQMQDAADVVVIDEPAVVDGPPANGQVRYTWTDSDVARAGSYKVWVVADSALGTVTAPSRGHNQVIIETAATP